MKILWCSLIVIVFTVIALVGIWCPEYYSSAFKILCGAWKEILTLIVLVLAGFLLVCFWYPLKKRKRVRVTEPNGKEVDSEKVDPEELYPPYPDPPVWKSISGFQYESHLELMRLNCGLKGLGREAQYIVAKDYKVSFDLDGKRRSIIVRRGTLTDLASIPRPFRILVGRVGPHLEASIVHDYQYIAWQFAGIAPNEQMRRFSDELMLVAMNAAGMGCKARLIFRALRLFGCYAFFRENPTPLVLSEDQLLQLCHGGNDRNKP